MGALYASDESFATTPSDTPVVYNVGDTGPAGGIVFYDKGDYLNDWRYLEAASSDQANTYAWGRDGTVVGSTETGIGSGKANTVAIVAALGDNGSIDYAAKICNEHAEGGFTDWFLPSKDELNALYVQRSTIGGFSSNHWYWSSSEVSSSKACDQGFDNNGFPAETSKADGRNGVRPVRAF